MNISQFLGFFHRLYYKLSKVFREMDFSYPQVKELVVVVGGLPM